MCVYTHTHLYIYIFKLCNLFSLWLVFYLNVGSIIYWWLIPPLSLTPFHHFWCPIFLILVLNLWAFSFIGQFLQFLLSSRPWPPMVEVKLDNVTTDEVRSNLILCQCWEPHLDLVLFNTEPQGKRLNWDIIYLRNPNCKRDVLIKDFRLRKAIERNLQKDILTTVSLSEWHLWSLLNVTSD